MELHGSQLEDIEDISDEADSVSRGASSDNVSVEDTPRAAETAHQANQIKTYFQDLMIDNLDMGLAVFKIEDTL